MRKIAAALMVSSVLLLGGCEAAIIGAATPGIIKQDRVNLTNTSYAAVDVIVQQAGKRFPAGSTLSVADLQELIDMSEEKPTANPKVGRVIAGQMRDRFVQLGYSVIDDASYQNASGIGELTGTYEFISNRMNVALALKDAKSGKIITTYHYSLPMTYDIKKYMTRNANSLPAFPPLL